MIAGGLGATLESRLVQGARIVSTMPASSFAGVSLMLLPWLLSAGTLCLHHRYDFEVLARQRRDEACQMLVMPGALALRLAQTGAFAHDERGAIIGAWRSPERLRDSPVWSAANVILVDVPIFGEAGLLAARRGADGRPAPIPLGPVSAPRDGTGGVIVGEVVATPARTVGCAARWWRAMLFLQASNDRPAAYRDRSNRSGRHRLRLSCRRRRQIPRRDWRSRRHGQRRRLSFAAA